MKYLVKIAEKALDILVVLTFYIMTYGIASCIARLAETASPLIF
jgi:hypothetical protein